MRILIVEDEKPAVNRLIKMINEIDSQIKIAGDCSSVKDTVQWLKQNDRPDLMLLDIQLSDGSSFELFNKIKITCPVVFATAYDEHILESFNYNAIDYLLKPIKKEKLKSALSRYKELKSHFSTDIYDILAELNKSKQQYKTRFLVKSGSTYRSISIKEVILFYSEHKITFLLTNKNEKLIVDKPLSSIEEEIDPSKFFRMNRQFLVNINSIKKFTSIEGSKLAVELLHPVKEKIIVSQEKAALFKEWLSS